MINSLRWLAFTLLALGPTGPALAERMQSFGQHEAHYSLVPTTLLAAAVAADYGISRGRDRALLNVSILDAGGHPVQAQVSGTVKDLLGQQREIAFREIVEGEAVYYLAEIRHSDREVLRFAIDIETAGGETHQLTFQQKMYWEAS